MLNGMIVEPVDNVVVAIEPVKKGETVTYMCAGEEKRLTAAEDITIYHKLAACDIAKGQPIVKYGTCTATTWKSTGKTWTARAEKEDTSMNFYGYKRPDGRVGVRNKVLILPASVCASDTTRIISQQVVGSVTFNNQLGCSQVAPDQQFTMDVMAGYAANPNVYGTVVVSLGCENCQMDLVVKAIQERTNKPLKQVIIQEAGGTLKAIDMAVRYAKEMVEEASLLQKEEFPMSELIIGTECGGSDPTSGLAANPLIGQLSDLIVKEGGTSILSETTEFIGAEHLLARRAINKEVHDRIFEIVHRYEDSLRLVGEEVREGNPSPGNKAGGLTCLEEKSLGCIHKGGHSPVMAVYDYAKQVEVKQGLVIMDTPAPRLWCSPPAAAPPPAIPWPPSSRSPATS